MLVASLAAVAMLTGLSPTDLLKLMAARTHAIRADHEACSRRCRRSRMVPLYSDVWYDDSGISTAIDFEAPVTDITSLAQVGAAQSEELRGE